MDVSITPERLRALADDRERLEVMRRAIEDELVELRDSGMSLLGQGNGFAIQPKTPDPRISGVLLRMSTAEGLVVGLRALADALEAEK